MDVCAEPLLRESTCEPYPFDEVLLLLGLQLINRKDSKLSSITAVATDPGSLVDSRALRTNTPPMLFYMSIFVLRPLRFLLRFVDPKMRVAAEAGADVVDLATNKAHPGDRGYFTLLKRDASAPASMEEETQQKLWIKTMEWTGIPRENTAL